MDDKEIRFFIEAALLASGRPMNVDQLQKLFDGRSAPDKQAIRTAIADLVEEYEPRGFTIAEVASGFRIQIKANMADRLHKLWEERPPRYSRALFETLALIAYRQPITRGEIEDIRGVSVSSNIVRTLLERDWVRVVGHRDVPGRPAMFGTTKGFLDYFGLKKLDDLPELADLADWESLRVQLDLPDVGDDEDERGAAVPVEIPVVFADAEAENEEVLDADELLTPVEEPTAPGTDPGESSSADEVEEELVVSEWPDPADAKGITSFDTGSDDDEKDASAGSA